ncbi:MAG: penicillin-binding transpeptidase domain-containing protein, partial [Persicimonas sp.]
MSNRESDRDPDFGRFAACAAALSALAVGLTALTAGADEPPSDKVDGAQQVAERAAASEAAQRKLDPEGDGRARREARKHASSIAGAARSFEPVEAASLPHDWVEAGLDIERAEREGDRLVQELSNGGKVYLTLDADLQEHLEKLYANRQVPHGGLALVEPQTGRVLALVSHSQSKPALPQLARKATAPSASVFKIVTAAALIEGAGVEPYEDVCYHGGVRHLTESNIKGDPNLDNKCANLRDAVARSINSVIAKLTYQKLDREDLELWAERFGYNTEIPFELPVEESKADIVEDPFERARTAAGFWNTYLSPLHGALISAAVANDGVMMRPSLIEAYEAPSGEVVHEFEPRVHRRVMEPETAEVLGELMQGTVDYGTARRYFTRVPSEVEVAGKTGTLSDKDPYLGYTWFVGYGENPAGQKAAVSGLACNKPQWQIKGTYAASEG